MKLTRRRLIAGGGALGVGGGGVLLATDSSVTFTSGVSERTRRRCRRVSRRLPDLVSASLSGPITVSKAPAAMVDTDQDPFERVVDDARHVDRTEWPPQVPGPLGWFDADSRTIVFADLESLLGRIDSMDLVGISPEMVRRTFPNEPFVAHEFTHAIQWDTVGQTGARQQTHDARGAARSVHEGTAEYAQSVYRGRCLRGEFSDCGPTPSYVPSLADVPRWLLTDRNIRYVNGAQFVEYVLERYGWEKVWEVHRAPPATAAEIMFPERYFGGQTPVPTVETTDPSESEWLVAGSDRLGVNALYLKLDALGRVDPTTAEPPTRGRSITSDRYGPGGYRTDLLRTWETDQCVGYVHVDSHADRGYVWVTRWGSQGAARQVASTVAAGYDDVGRRTDGGWYLDGQFLTIRVDHRTVTFGAGPTPEATARITGESGTWRG